MSERKTRKNFSTEKEWLLHQQATLKARIVEIERKETAKKRKLDTRRKIILGGAVLALQEKEQYNDPRLTEYVRNSIQEKDKHLFPKLFQKNEENND